MITDHVFQDSFTADSALGQLCTCGQPIGEHGNVDAAMPTTVPATVLGVVPAPDPIDVPEHNGPMAEPTPTEFVIPGTPAKVIGGPEFDLAEARLAPVLGDARRLDRLEQLVVGLYRGEHMTQEQMADYHATMLGLIDAVDRRAAAQARFLDAGRTADQVRDRAMRGGVARG